MHGRCYIFEEYRRICMHTGAFAVPSGPAHHCQRDSNERYDVWHERGWYIHHERGTDYCDCVEHVPAW